MFGLICRVHLSRLEWHLTNVAGEWHAGSGVLFTFLCIHSLIVVEQEEETI